MRGGKAWRNIEVNLSMLRREEGGGGRGEGAKQKQLPVEDEAILPDHDGRHERAHGQHVVSLHSIVSLLNNITPPPICSSTSNHV